MKSAETRMDNPERPKHRFQFHLAALLGVVLVAGAWGTVWVCFASSRHRVGFREFKDLPTYATATVTTSYYETIYGLPWPCIRTYGDVAPYTIQTMPLLLDLVVLLCLLAGLFIFSEWLIRRRARQATLS